MSELIILTASATLMGPDVREHLFERVSRLYTTLDEGITPLSVLSKFSVLWQSGTECSVTTTSLPKHNQHPHHHIPTRYPNLYRPLHSHARSSRQRRGTT